MVVFCYTLLGTIYVFKLPTCITLIKIKTATTTQCTSGEETFPPAYSSVVLYGKYFVFGMNITNMKVRGTNSCSSLLNAYLYGNTI